MFKYLRVTSTASFSTINIDERSEGEHHPHIIVNEKL